MINVSGTLAWSKTHPGAVIGLLEISGAENVHGSPELNQRKRQVEARLRDNYAGFTRRNFLALPVMAAYDKYYSHFDKT
jgi:hypothetical protein